MIPHIIALRKICASKNMTSNWNLAICLAEFPITHFEIE